VLQKTRIFLESRDQSLSAQTTEENFQMNPVKDEIETKRIEAEIPHWKFKNFKFPSPLPDGHNNFISSQVHQRKKNMLKEIL